MRNDACLGKVKFKTHKQARIALKRVRRKHHGNHMIYQCHYCKQFHIGQSSK